MQYKDENIVRWASTTKPTVGGFSFYITFLLAGIVYLILAGKGFAAEKEFGVVLGIVTLGFLIGLHDDAYETKPLIKFLGQVACGVILIVFGMHIRLFDFWPVDYFLTIFWVVGIMNSINLLDNMDGVTATVSLTIVGTTLMRMVVFGYDEANNAFIFTMIAAIGSFVGFLAMNLKPSKIYMGDTGSQFLGALLAVLGVQFFWNFDVAAHPVDWPTRAIVPIMVFLVPMMDTSFVTIARIMRKQSPFVGGKDHLTHHLTYIGVSDGAVPFVLGLISLGSGALAIFGLRYLFTWTAIQSAIFVSFIAICFIIFWRLYKRGERIGRAKHRFAKTFERAFKARQENSEKAKQHS